MSKKRQNQKPTVKNSLPDCPITLLDFQRMFPDEAACLRYLEQLRWPDGFSCRECSKSSEPFRIAVRPRVLKCRSCQHEVSITADTVMHRSKTSILVWFWAAYLVSTQTPGISAMALQKKLGITRYETAFQILHKLRGTMVRPGRDKIGTEWPLELDIIFVGGNTRSGIHGVTNQAPVIVAVEIRRKEIRNKKNNKIVKRGLAGRVRLLKLSNKTAPEINKFSKDCLAPGASIVSDDGTEFTNLKALGYNHKPVPMYGDRDKKDSALPLVSRVTANLKTWIDGTFHGVRKKHLQAYLEEFTFRFNSRFYRSVSFRSLLDLGMISSGVTYREVYDISDQDFDEKA